MLGWFRCWIGLHRMRSYSRWLPSPTAPVVTEMIDRIWCERCGYVLIDQHVVWNGREFVAASDPDPRAEGGGT